MDYTAHLRETARHLIAMADEPAFRAHAAHSLEWLKTLHPMYDCLPDLIAHERERMKEGRG